MAVTDFRSLKEEIVNDTILNTFWFAEEVRYTPVSGNARTITVKISQNQDAEFDDAGDEELRDRIEVKVRKDATLGISDPQLGDMLTRSVSRDSDRRPYVYSGEKPQITETHWTLMYWRHKRTGRSPR